MTGHAIAVDNLVKSYGRVTALNQISMNMSNGERFGLIGPDGAGKTTLIRILCALLPFDSGTATVGGVSLKSNARRIRSSVGYMPQRFSLYSDLSVDENIRFYADLFGVSASERKHRVEELLAFSRLEPFLKRKAGKLSGGMKQKLALACTLIHQPTILFLDEPTTGVDPLSRDEFWKLLEQLNQKGITLIIATAYMEEASNCHHIALMADGEILEVDTPDNIRNKYPHPLFDVSTPHPFAAASALENTPGILSVQMFGSGIHVATDRAHGPPDIRSKLNEEGITIEHIQPIEPGIEDVFVDRLSRLDGEQRNVK